MQLSSVSDMQKELQVDHWRSQSGVTFLGSFTCEAIDKVPSDTSSLREVSRELVAHYMGASDGSSGLITGDRLKEADLRYADRMFNRLLEIGIPNLNRKRRSEERIAGCCRDFAVLFVAMARHKGIPSRVRVGYATYFQPGWYLDHVIAEIWDMNLKRWKLVEPEISESIFTRGNFDPLDVPPEKFVTGPRAWLAARSGQVDPEKFVVAPDLEIPYTRSWLSLRHHLVQDLAALSKLEMLVWDQWGILNENDPLQHASMLDRLAHVTVDSNCAIEDLVKWSLQESLKVPSSVTSYSPTQEAPLTVDVNRALEGMIKF
jgi:hypothetical protein